MKTRETIREHAIASRSTLGSGSLNRSAQIGPIHIRAEVFAANHAAGSLFDGWAALCRHLLGPGFPLADNYWRNAQNTSQILPCAATFEIVFQVHAQHISLRQNESQ